MIKWLKEPIKDQVSQTIAVLKLENVELNKKLYAPTQQLIDENRVTIKHSDQLLFKS